MPTPKEGESEKDFVSRCMGYPDMQKHDQEQRAAICYSMFQQKEKKAASRLILRHDHKVLSSAAVRRERVDGREKLVAPVVILTHTVIACATCPVPELTDPNDFAKNPSAWNGHPVTYDHPMSGAKQYLSAHDSRSVGFVIGEIHNAVRKGEKLCGEAWIDVQRAKDRGAGELLARIEAGESVEISPGFYADTRPESGEFKGKKYGAVEYNTVPDHLAILPQTQRGACSWDDGCGVRAAMKAASSGCADSDGSCCPACTVKQIVASLIGGETTDLHRSLQETLVEANPGAEYCFVIATAGQQVTFGMDGEQYEQSYKANGDGDVLEIVLEGKPKRVRSIPDYVRALTEAKMEKKELIDRVCAGRKFEGEQEKEFRAALEKMDDAGLKLLAESTPEPLKEKTPEEKAKEEADAKAKGEADAKVAAAKKDEPTPEMKWLTGRLEKEREKFTTAIKAATKVYTDDDLKVMSFDLLEKTAQALDVASNQPSDFSGRGGPRSVTEKNADPLADEDFDKRVKALREGKAA